MKIVLKSMALLSLILSSHIAFAACSADIEVGDALTFSVTQITVEKSCGNVTINLKHTGKLAATVMGHNWVLTKDTDANDVASKGLAAGLGNNYVPVGDNRVLATTKIIGGGESTSVSFSTAALTAGGKYIYVCTFPGHSFVMRGTLNVGA